MTPRLGLSVSLRGLALRVKLELGEQKTGHRALLRRFWDYTYVR